MPNHFHFVVPGELATLTGGYIYDRRIVEGARALGWEVDVHELDDGFPCPTAAARQRAADVLGTIPDRSLVVMDGLALGAMPALVEAVSARLRCVALIHHPLAQESGLSESERGRLESDERRALAAPARVIVTSGHTARSLHRVYGVAPGRITVVEPGTARAPGSSGGDGRVVQLLCVATVIPRKGHALLVEALARLSHLPWRLTCIGSLQRAPATVAALRTQIRRRGLQSRIRLWGETDAETLASAYSHSDVFVLPSLHEGYGMAPAEALAHGLPIVGTRAGAMVDTVPAEAGYLTPLGDIDAFGEAMALVIQDPDLRQRLARGARAAGLALPTWADTCRRFVAALAR